MRILAIQFASDLRGRPVPRFEPQLGTLLALLRERGHELTLLGQARFELAALKESLARCLPQLVYADISGVSVRAARRALEYIHEHEFLPVIAGGNYPSVDPAGSLSLPGVHAVAIGEPDASLLTYLERMKDPAAGQVVLGVWQRDEQGLARPNMPPLVEDLDSLPFPERDLFGYGEYVRATGQIELAVGRGCPQACAYCPNDWFESIYDEESAWVRRRSPENILTELRLLRGRYDGARLVRFLDHAFAQDADWLHGFLERYRAGCELPFRCHLRLNQASAAVVAELRQAGCLLVDVELISSSNLIRNEIFDMDLSEEQIRQGFALLRDAGILTRVIVYLGAPYESETSLDLTRQMLLRVRPNILDARFYYPWPGTRAVDVCRENGWLHARGEEQYQLERCGIDMPACPPELVASYVRRLRREFPPNVAEPWWRRWSVGTRSPLEALFNRKRGGSR